MANKSTQKQWKTRVETPSAPYSAPSKPLPGPLPCDGKDPFRTREVASFKLEGANEGARAPLLADGLVLSKRYWPDLCFLNAEGLVEYRQVGTHRRVRFESLMAYKRKADAERRAALAELGRL